MLYKLMTIIFRWCIHNIFGVLLWHSGLRIWHCLSCGIGHSCSSDLIPGPGTSICCGWSQKKTNKNTKKWKNDTKKKKKKKKKKKRMLNILLIRIFQFAQNIWGSNNPKSTVSVLGSVLQILNHGTCPGLASNSEWYQHLLVQSCFPPCVLSITEACGFEFSAAPQFIPFSSHSHVRAPIILPS